MLTLTVGTLSLNAGTRTVNVPIDTGTMLGGFTPTSASTLKTKLTGSGSLVKTSGGTLVLDDSVSASNYTGGTTFNGGMVQTVTNTSLGSGGAWSFTGGGVLFGSATTGTYSPTGTISVGAGGGTLSTGGTATTATINALINDNTSGGAGLTTSGLGAVFLTATGANTITSGLNVAGGTLSLGNDSNTGGSINLTGTATAAINNGGTLMFDDNAGSIARLNSSGTVTVNSGGLLLKGPSAGGADTQSVNALQLFGATTIALRPPPTAQPHFLSETIFLRQITPTFRRRVGFSAARYSLPDRILGAPQAASLPA